VRWEDDERHKRLRAHPAIDLRPPPTHRPLGWSRGLDLVPFHRLDNQAADLELRRGIARHHPVDLHRQTPEQSTTNSPARNIYSNGGLPEAHRGRATHGKLHVHGRMQRYAIRANRRGQQTCSRIQNESVRALEIDPAISSIGA